jgi:hypothetical protein
MDARRIVIVGRFGRRLFWCALGATLALGPGAASAQDSGNDPCSNTHPLQPIPNCRNLPISSLSFRGPATHGLVFSCTGSPGHPYFYHFDNGFAVNNSSNCWTFAEEAGGNSSQFVGTFTNNCSDIEQLSVALACSDTPQPPSD